jgi:HEAT repeat protein
MHRPTLFVMAALLPWCTALVAADEATVETLAGAVASEDQATAVAAIDDLGRMGSEARAAVPALIEALGRQDEVVRGHAARTLAAIGPEASDAVPALVTTLGDSDPLVKAYAAYALGQIGQRSEAAVEKLLETAFDTDPKVRRESIHALRRIDAPLEQTRPVLLKILEEGDPGIVLPALRTMAEDGAAAVPRLREALQDDKLCYWACLVLAEIGPDGAAAVPELAACVKHSDPHVRLQALITLGEIGPGSAAAVPDVVNALENDPFDAVRRAAAFALGAIGQKDEAVTRALVAAARTEDPILKAISLWAIARQNPENVKVLTYAAEVLAAGLKSDDTQLRSVSARALAEFGDHPDIVGPALLAALRDADPEVVGHAMDALAVLGPKVLPKATEALEDPEVRDYAAMVLYRLGPQAAPAVPALIAALAEPPASDEDRVFRRELQLVLAAIGPEAKEAVPALIESLASDDREVRGTAAYALGKIGPAAAAAAEKLTERLEQLEAAEDKVALVWALLKLKPGDPALAAKAVPLLLGALDHQESLVRMEAAASLGEIGPPAAQPEVIDRLKQLLTDPDDAVQAAAAATLQKLEPQPEEAVPFPFSDPAE